MISDPAAFDAMKDSWDALAALCPTPTQQHDWLSACATQFAGDGNLQVVTVHRDGRLVAAAPLCRTEAGDLELLGWEMYEPTDVLYEDEEALGSLARALAELRAPLLLRRIPADSPTIAALTRAYGRRGLVNTRPTDGTPTLALSQEWTAPEGGLSSRRRSDLRRARRKAQELGELEIDLRMPTLDDVDETLAEAFAVEAASWRAETGTTMHGDELRGGFMRELARRSAADGRLRIGFLRINGEAAAMQIALELDERLWLLKIAFDQRFSRCSPGTLLLLETLRDGAARGLRSCEMLGSVEPWTDAWTTDVHPLVGLRARPVGVRALRDAGAIMWRKARGDRDEETRA